MSGHTVGAAIAHRIGALITDSRASLTENRDDPS
jgi:hypothetical protein